MTTTTRAPLTGGERLYRIGVNTDCPLHQIFAGGQCFPRRSQRVTGYGVETKRVDLQGSIVRMQEGQLDKCIESSKHKIIRSTRGRKSRSRVYDKRNPKFRAMPGDQPVIDFMWFEEIETLTNPFEPIAKKTIADHLSPPAKRVPRSRPQGARPKE